MTFKLSIIHLFELSMDTFFDDEQDSMIFRESELVILPHHSLYRIEETHRRTAVLSGLHFVYARDTYSGQPNP